MSQYLKHAEIITENVTCIEYKSGNADVEADDALHLLSVLIKKKK